MLLWCLWYSVPLHSGGESVGAVRDLGARLVRPLPQAGIAVQPVQRLGQVPRGQAFVTVVAGAVAPHIGV